MKFKEFKHVPVEPDTYEASMALNQLMRIGKHAIKLHNMIDDAAEMESWVAKKIDLAGDYVKKVYNYTEGEKAGLYDDGGMTEIKKMPKGTGTMYGVKEDLNNLETAYKQIAMLANNVTKEPTDADDQMDIADDVARPITKILSTIMDYDKGEQMPDGSASKTTYVDMYKKLGMLANKGAQTNDPKVAPLLFKIMSSIYDMDKVSEGSIQEDAGEGHMSKSTLYHTAKYAIALMQMIKKGDDLEGWVQSKLNKAADYLQGVYNYEEYQKLNPYREELDSGMIARHSQIIQKNIDEILAKETEVDDIDTKPGMMRILAKRVNEVEKKLAKDTRKQDEGRMSDIDADMKTLSDADFMKKYKKSKEQMKKDLNEDGHMDVPSAIRNCETIIEDAMQMKQKLQTMEGELPSWMTQMIAVAASDLNDARDYLLNPTTESGIMYRAGVKKYGKKGMTAIQSAAGKGASHQEIGKIKDKYLKDEEELEEGLKDWAKGLAMAGVFVAGLAGVGSIQDAIDRSVPAVQAMEKAYDMAMDAGNEELANMINKDLSAVKVRLDSGRDLNFVKDMQNKYIKFMPTEALAYESKLAVLLNQRIK